MKTELLLFSDFHGHNFPYAAKRVPIEGLEGLYNSRLRDSAQVLDYIHAYGLDHDINHILFAGDLYHRRTSVHTDVRAVVTQKLIDIAHAGQDMFSLDLMLGNHDMGDKFGHVHSLTGLECVRNIEVRTEMCAVQRGHVQIVFVPYTPKLSQAKEWLKSAGEIASQFTGPTLLLGHLGMKGARVGNDFVLLSESDVTVEDVPYDKFAACFFGHFHEHQQLFRNGWFIGASHEHNWGDSGGQRGFLHVVVDGHKVSFTRVETAAPKHVVFHEDTPIETRSQDFVKIVGSEGFVKSVQHMSDMEVFTPGAHFEYIQEVEDAELDFKLDSDKLDPGSVIKAWVEHKCPKELNADEVLAVGLRILGKV